MADALEWMARSAPTLAEMEAMAEDAYARLPESFRQLCGNMVVRVEDFPSEVVQKEMETESEFDLLGLFQGIGLAQGYEMVGGNLPNMIFLYRRPILDYWAEHEETLGDVVTHVLVHEIGHHFGLSDDDMERVEEAAG